MMPVGNSPVRGLSVAAKLGIGAGAGFCLSLVKMLEVNFYLGQPSPVIIGGVLTVLAFAVVAAMFTAFGTDEQDTGKLFMQGLLAPSLVIALVHRGADVSSIPGSAATTIPSLGSITEVFVPSLYAAEQDPATTARSGSVQTVKAGRFDGSAIDGALMLLGRAPAQSSYVYVVGKTNDEKQALAASAKVRQAAQAAGIPSQVQVIKPEGTNDLYVTVGAFQSATAAAATKKEIVSKVVAAPAVDQSALRLLVNGPVVDARTFMKQ
jgi:hypothetical protein